jgi:hypothetical protein
MLPCWVTFSLLVEALWVPWVASSSSCLVVAWLVVVRCVLATCGTLPLWSSASLRDGRMGLIFPLVLQVVDTPCWLLLLPNPPRVVFGYC